MYEINKYTYILKWRILFIFQFEIGKVYIYSCQSWFYHHHKILYIKLIFAFAHPILSHKKLLLELIPEWYGLASNICSKAGDCWSTYSYKFNRKYLWKLLVLDAVMYISSSYSMSVLINILISLVLTGTGISCRTARYDGVLNEYLTNKIRILEKLGGATEYLFLKINF